MLKHFFGCNFLTPLQEQHQPVPTALMFVAALLVKEEMIRVTDILPHVRFIFWFWLLCVH